MHAFDAVPRNELATVNILRTFQEIGVREPVGLPRSSYS